jgi:ribonuclease-3
MKISYKELEQAIGYRFRKKSLLELALTHPSFRYEDSATTDDNQRLEYLGDAALSLVAAEHLFETQPESREGDLSQLRSRLTQDRTLARIGADIGLQSYLRLGRGEQMSGGAERASNLADALEAIIGAAWIDGGARAVNRIFNRIFLAELDGVQDAPVKANPKGTLQEYAQSRGFGIPEYEIIETAGPEHDRVFTVRVRACDQSWQASAGSKREAERQAAELALADLT